MHHRRPDDATETDDDDVGFFWKLGHEYSPLNGRQPRLKKISILEMQRQRDAVAQASPNALKCDPRKRWQAVTPAQAVIPAQNPVIPAQAGIQVQRDSTKISGFRPAPE
jgi:hypothetical protein